ncbi:sugar ABC transporter permease [Streptomyces netropsis]|uniref:Arabinogalactan oligomer/maltooligosaccharide transport system permease protein n=1 Tax=Streptomyces netropsis TaxID=55404 RepID=A0A7W7L6P8_STRNE|nr:arabinogalactan oligomer/maltooligosaccharide transport system permease protein [Streptomyces netropsis]GGR02474.1 ABC transporter permease [Streptomyces netropsis]
MSAMSPGTTGPAKSRPRGERSRGVSVALHTALIVASLVSVFPVLFVVFVSLRGRDGWQEPTKFVGFELSNYTHILNNTEFLTWFGNSVIIALGATVLGVLVAATAGYAVSRMRFPGHRPLMWTFLVVQMFPMAVLIVPLYNILGRLELLDSYTGLILTYCSISVPFCAWMLKGYFDTIPAEIDEAGRVDGLSPFGTFWRLILPLARPGLAVTGFYSFITAWGEVAFATQFMSSEKHYTLAVGLQTFVGQQKAEWGLMTAAAVLITVPAGLVFFLAQKHLVAGLTAGGTKG